MSYLDDIKAKIKQAFQHKGVKNRQDPEGDELDEQIEATRRIGPRGDELGERLEDDKNLAGQHPKIPTPKP